MFPGVMETNLTVSARVGTTVTADASAHTKGAWTELIASTGGDAEAIVIAVREVGAPGTDTSQLLDIGIGAAASETVLVPDINTGYASHAGSEGFVGKVQMFAVAVASGSRLSARVQGVIGSDTVEVSIWLLRSVQHLDGASAVEAVGEDAANSRGTSVTPGSGAWGTWTSLGTIGADRNLVIPMLDGLGDTGMQGGDEATLMQLGYGSSAPGSGGTAIEAIWRMSLGAAEAFMGLVPQIPAYADLASGETIWCRLASGQSTEARGVLVHAMEGVAVAGGAQAMSPTHDYLVR